MGKRSGRAYLKEDKSPNAFFVFLLVFYQSELMEDLGIGGWGKTLPSYTLFPEYYSEHIAPFLYESWERFFKVFIHSRKKEGEACADVACGPGLAAEFLAKRFRRVYAVDRSLPMLRRAWERLEQENVIFLRQDMRFMRLPEPVDLITCWGDSLNHLTDERDLVWAFRSFAANLKEGGFLVFDLNMERELREGAGEEWYEMGSSCGKVLWRLLWNEGKRQADLELVFFDEKGREAGRELIREKAFRPETVLQILKEACFDVLEWVDAATHEAPTPKTRRVAALVVKR